jgi:hypothetical protein
VTTRLARVLALLSPLVAVPVGAQSLAARLVESLQPAVSVVGGAADHRVDAHLGIEHTSGPVAGVRIDVVPLEGTALFVRALGGTLGAQSAKQRDLGEAALGARMRLLAWLDARGTLTTRTFSSSLARQRWTSASLGADVRTTLLDGRIEGTAGGELFPLVRVTGHPSPDLAVGASTALRWASRRYVLALGYALERYDFPSDAAGRRLEQHSMLTVRAGYRFGKAPKAGVE